VSLWPVSDDATGILMAAFYRKMQTMSASDALRQAQLTVLADERYTHPYFWAAFNLNGDPR
jgi:CHAT domain-containing protein